jgi:4-amino-4-deoxy-L-arabinose transferase-like glycosyltransferase
MTKQRDKTNHGLGKWLVLLVALHVILALVYWHYTPYGAPPDEGVHGNYVHALVRDKALAVFDPSDRANYEAHQPPLYYVMAVPFYLVGRALDLPDPGIVVRLLSLILGAAAIVVGYRAVLRAFDDEKVALGAAGFIALLPTHVMLSSSVSNDILAELVFGLALLVVAGIVVDGSSWKRTTALGVVLGAGLLAKTTCVLLFPMALLAYALMWRRGKGRSIVLHAAVLAGLSVIIGGWWFARNQMLYGDALGISQFQQAFGHTAKPEYWLGRGWSGWMYALLVIGWTFAGFWGVFAHTTVFMPTWSYVVLAFISVAVISASVRGAVRLKENLAGRKMLLVYGVTLALVVLAFALFNLRFFQAQGRYLYPAIVPISALWAIGISGLLPAAKRRYAPYVALAIPAAVQIIALTTCIIPRMPWQ